jgi:hypothetical protein
VTKKRILRRKREKEKRQKEGKEVEGKERKRKQKKGLCRDRERVKGEGRKSRSRESR